MMTGTIRVSEYGPTRVSWSYHFQWDRLFSLWLHFPWLGLFFVFFTRLLTRAYTDNKQAFTNGKCWDFFANETKKSCGSLRHLEPTKSGSYVSGNAVGLMTSTTDFVWQPNYAYKLSICCLFGSRFYVSGTLVTPAQSITQFAMQCNTIERSCTS